MNCFLPTTWWCGRRTFLVNRIIINQWDSRWSKNFTRHAQKNTPGYVHTSCSWWHPQSWLLNGQGICRGGQGSQVSVDNWENQRTQAFNLMETTSFLVLARYPIRKVSKTNWPKDQVLHEHRVYENVVLCQQVSTHAESLNEMRNGSMLLGDKLLW